MARLYHILAILPALLLLSVSTVFAGNPLFQLYTTRDGLAGNYITAIAFEPNGSAWVGTSEGATHISDAGWVSYTLAHGLGDGFVTAIAIAPDAGIWFGTRSGGLAVFDPRAKTFTPYTLDNSDVPSNFITALAIDPKNRVWVGTLNKGVARYDVTSNIWTRFELPSPEITALALDSDNLPWVGTPNGAFHFDGANWVRSNNVGDANVRRIDAFDGEWYLTTDNLHFTLRNNVWVANDGAEPVTDALNQANLKDGQITAFGQDYLNRFWFGTARGLYMVQPGLTLRLNFPPPFPVVLVHGWTVAGDDTLETSEFRFLNSYAGRDGIPMYYARGISPKNTLYQNAVAIRDEIVRVKKETGRRRVNIVAFSMGGMNTRAYLESSLYGDDVNRVIILGTPQAGVELWKPILMRQILEKYDQPSAVELSPEYSGLINQVRSPNPTVPYDLLVGDARSQTGLDFLTDMPPSDALISVSSALSLDAPNVRKHINADLHDWSPEPVPLDLTGYLYPRETWDRYLRNALRNRDNAPIGSEVFSPPAAPGTTTAEPSNHTPVLTQKLGAGETITNTVLVDENMSARFVAYYPGGKMDFSLVAPDGKRYEPGDLPGADDSGVLSLSTDIASFSGYVVKNAPVGEWKMILTRTDSGDAPVEVSTYVELNAPLRLGASQSSETLEPGASNTITAQLELSTRTAPSPSMRVNAFIAQPAPQTGNLFAYHTLELFDDGMHNDGGANDGTFANNYTPLRPGWYVVLVQAQGANFAREREMLFSVSPAGARLENSATLTRNGKNLRINVGVNVQRAGNYALSAQVRKQGTPEIVARAFSPFTFEQGVQRAGMRFDAQQIPGGDYTVDVILLDATGAAIPLDSRANLSAFTQP